MRVEVREYEKTNEGLISGDSVARAHVVENLTKDNILALVEYTTEPCLLFSDKIIALNAANIQELTTLDNVDVLAGCENVYVYIIHNLNPECKFIHGDAIMCHGCHAKKCTYIATNEDG